MTAGQSLADGAAGVALLYLETGRWSAARTALERATADGASIAGTASLYYGAPALAFVLASSSQACLARAQATAAEGTAAVTRCRLAAAHRRIDQGQPPDYTEYDLIGGLTGLAVVLRRIGNYDLLREVLTYLVRLTEPIGGLPGWWCRSGPSRGQPGLAGGHSNHGTAHGITGTLALLALTLNDGTIVSGHAEAITRICQWLDTWQQQGGGTWWPQTITLDDLRCGRPAEPGPKRPSWCYGTPGIARAQQLAGRALGDTWRQRLAENAFSNCISDPGQTSRLTSRGLCHGTAGLLAAGRRIAADALSPISVTPLLRLHQQAPPAGEPAGLLDGTAGAALASTATMTSWDSCLLLS
jgi:hypothetical protein